MAEQEMISAVASSSNSFSTPTVGLKNYDVFLSFRGEDTRKNIVSHLHQALERKKVVTYIDEQLQKGDEITVALIDAIEASHISVIVFSENYASSKWCLGELNKILKCRKDQGQIVIPIFYNVDPSDVRKQTGSYKQAFAKHEGELRCDKWKADLNEAANLSGFDLKTYRDEYEFLMDIVRNVLQKLADRYPNQVEGLIGIEENYEQIKSLLKLEPSEVRILGIWGMVGIGKTALATALYAELSPGFESSCFLTNVRKESEKDGLTALYKKLFSELLEDENLFSNAPFSLPQFSKIRLGRKKVFIVLDDVDTSEQFENLVKDKDFLGPGSIVIVTSRNKQILRADEIYEVKELNPDNSLQLFCLAAFKEKQPKHGYEDLSRVAISYCKGNPLALKSVGASLWQRSEKAWKDELRNLQKTPNKKFFNELKSSYDGLDPSHKDIFLDIACFFKGWDKDRVISLLDPCDFFPKFGIEVLLDKALITISDGNIEMHELIQKVGWEIVREECTNDPGRRSRLWNHEDVRCVFKYNMGTEFVEGLIFDLSKLSENICLSSNSFARMTNLRFLQIHGWCLINRFNVSLPNGLESLSDKLRYLHWDGFCLESLPSNFCAEQLVELHMTHSNLKKLWDGYQNLVNLKQINVDGSQDLIDIPDLSTAKKLESFSCLL